MGIESLGYTADQLLLLSDEELVRLNELLEAQEEDVRLSKAKDCFLSFAEYIEPEHKFIGFHKVYYEVLDLFAKGVIKRLIVTVPPQHGKSSGSTIKLPAYLLGKNPNLKIAIGSYGAELAKGFNSKTQNIIDSVEYNKIFPDTLLSGSIFDKKNTKGFSRTRDAFEVVGKKGELMSIGIGGTLTGKTIDLAILDDLYKNYEEANSPIEREKALNFYTSVVMSRFPKQELIVFTRWHEEDLIGYIELRENVYTIEKISDVYTVPKGAWVKINFEAIKESEPTEIDPRKYGDILAPYLRDEDALLRAKKFDKEIFECLYQGNPLNKEGLMYGEFGTYKNLPELRIIKCEVDPADKGTDWFCAVIYGLPLNWGDENAYVLDVMYTQEPMEVTEPQFINFVNRWNVNEVDIEINNGGRSFVRAIEKNIRAVINPCFQSKNKEARVFSNASKVTKDIKFPEGWEHRFDKFHSHIKKFKKLFKANKTDDGADILTSIIERKYEGFRIEDIIIEND